jgi:hypothetical protein
MIFFNAVYLCFVSNIFDYTTNREITENLEPKAKPWGSQQEHRAYGRPKPRKGPLDPIEYVHHNEGIKKALDEYLSERKISYGAYRGRYVT